MQIKIYYHHTDCGGVVYYAKYLEFLEEARTEFFAEKGISIKELTSQQSAVSYQQSAISKKLVAES